MPHPVRIGLQLRPQHATYEEYARAWLQADDMGVDTIYNWDHFYPLTGDPDGNHWEGWTTLAALGAQTKHAHIGCLVLPMSYRNPALLSAMTKTLDHATGGRLILGMGAGWFARDYNTYGYEFGTAGDRLRNLERGIKIVKERWQLDNPRPVRGTIPILIGGGGEKVTLRITAQHADLWNSFAPVGNWSRKNEILNEWCTTVGRDPTAIERTASINLDQVHLADDLLRAGATQIILGITPPIDMRPVEELLAWRDRQRQGC